MRTKVFHIFALLPFELVGIGYHSLHGSVFFEQFDGGFFPNPWNSWNVIHRISHQAQDIPYLIDVFNVPLFTDLSGAHHIHTIAHEGRLVQKDMVIHNLSIVLVWGHHVNGKQFLFRFFCDGTNDVVCLKSIHFQNRNSKGTNDLFYPRNRHGDILRLLQSIGLVRSILLVTESRCLGIKCHCDVAGFFFFQDLQERVGKAKHYSRVEPFGVDSGVFTKGKMSPIDQGHGVQKKKFMGLSL